MLPLIIGMTSVAPIAWRTVCSLSAADLHPAPASVLIVLNLFRWGIPSFLLHLLCPGRRSLLSLSLSLLQPLVACRAQVPASCAFFAEPVCKLSVLASCLVASRRSSVALHCVTRLHWSPLLPLTRTCVSKGDESSEHKSIDLLMIMLCSVPETG